MPRIVWIGKVKGFSAEVQHEIKKVLEYHLKGNGHRHQDNRTPLPLEIVTTDIDQFIHKVTFVASKDGGTYFVMDYSKALRL